MVAKPEETQPQRQAASFKAEETQPQQSFMETKPSESQQQPPSLKPEETQPQQSFMETKPSESQQQQPPSLKPEETQPQQQPSLVSSTSSEKPSDHSEKWGTHIMGQPADPSAHPNNQKAALWSGEEHHPYVQNTPIEKPSNNPMEPVIHVFNSWTHKAETLARNIWQNLNTGSSVKDAAWGKLGLTAKALTGGGFEALYKQTFNVLPNEKLKKTWACYLSTSTGPVAGTLYLSNVHVAFCSDRPLSFTAPSGQEAWGYYKVLVPLANIKAVNPVVMTDKNPVERYIQIITIDGHDFWCMGFVNYDKAAHNLQESVRESDGLQMSAERSTTAA